MANERQRQMMQDALDNVLSHEEREELFSLLDTDAESSQEYDQLQRVDQLMRTTPSVRAPKRLAVSIMARVAESMQAQARNMAQETSPEAQKLREELVKLAVELTSLITTPLLLSMSYAILNHSASPAMFNQILSQIVSSMMVIVEILDVLIARADELSTEDPEAASAVLAMIPVTVLAIARYFLDDLDDDEESGR